MNKSEIIRDLRKQCDCLWDHENQELWKCVSCRARDYIQLLTSRLKEIGCEHCDKHIKGMLE